MKKYELTEETAKFLDRTIHRIRACKDFETVNGTKIKKGDLGGFVEKEDNLSQEGCSWVGNDALVCDDAKVCGNAEVYDAAEVYGYAELRDNAEVRDNAKVCGSARVCDNAKVCGNARVCGDAYIGSV